MRIEYIKFHNFRQFKDETIHFSLNLKKNFIIIEGAMDSGKSTILNGITWCLYGKEIQLEEEQEGYPLINNLVLNRMKSGSSEKVEIEILMKDEGGKKHLFKRYITFRKVNKNKKPEVIKDPNSNSEDGSVFSYSRENEEGEDIILPEPKYFLEQIMPEEIKHYFFFDGDQLNLYFKQSTGKIIKEAVFEVSQISFLKDTIERLHTKKRELLKKRKGLGTEYENKKLLLESYEKGLKELEKNRLELINKKDKEKKKLDAISKELIDLGDINVTNLEERSKRLQEEIKDSRERLRYLESEKLDFILKFAPAILAHNRLTATLKMISAARKEHLIPSLYKKVFIEGLIDKGTCICGKDLKKYKDCLKELKKVLSKTSSITNVENEVLEINSQIQTNLDELGIFHEELIQKEKSMKNENKIFDEKTNEFKEIQKKLRTIDQPRVKNLQKQKENSFSQLEQINKGIGDIELRIKQEGSMLKECEKDLEQEKSAKEKDTSLQKILDFLNTVIESSVIVEERVIDLVRKNIEQKTKEQFFELHWKKENYKDVCITNDYTISLKDPKGWETIGTISKGTRQVLALSFLSALNSVSGFKAPIVIDTPLGRISKEPKINIAKNLHKFLKGRQITLLVTDEEYTEEVRENLSERVGKEYEINFIEGKEGSYAKVVPYGK